MFVDWTGAIAFKVGDFARWENVVYVCIAENIDEKPPSPAWRFVASTKGACCIQCAKEKIDSILQL